MKDEYPYPIQLLGVGFQKLE